MKNKISFNDKIFIAGASGMAGSAIKRELKNKGYGLENCSGKILTPSSEELNLLDKARVEEWFTLNKPTVVILAAAKVGGILANSTYPADFLLDNIKIQTNVIESAWKNDAKRLLFLGSSCIYPKFSKQPIKEDYLLKGELEPTNEWYAIAKIAGIKLCQSLRRQYNFDAISLMPTNLYGPGDNYHHKNSHVFASLIKKFCIAKKESHDKVICWGTGKPLREFMHVDDLGRAVLFTLEKWNPDVSKDYFEGQHESIDYLNVGTGKDISIYDLATKIAHYTNYSGEIIWDKSKPDGTPRKLLDVSKINKLGWEAKIDIEEGIKKTIKEFMNNNM